MDTGLKVAIMVEMDCLKMEIEILKERYNIGHINRDSYLDELLRLDTKICELAVEARNMRARLERD